MGNSVTTSTALTLQAVQEHLNDACKLEGEGQITDALAVMRHASLIANNGTEDTDIVCPFCWTYANT